MSTTAQGLLNDKPTEAEVERVDALWGRFNSTTQFLLALQRVLINREALDYEANALEKFLPILAQAEATSMNVPLAELATHRPTEDRYST